MQLTTWCRCSSISFVLLYPAARLAWKIAVSSSFFAALVISAASADVTNTVATATANASTDRRIPRPPPLDWALLPDTDANTVVAAGAVGQGPDLRRRLQRTGAVAGPDFQCVLARRGRLPQRRPQDPGVLAERGLDLRRLPGLAVVGGDLRRFDPAVAGVGHPAHPDLITQRGHHVAAAGSVELGHGLHDGWLTPPGPLPVPLEVDVDRLDLGDPLGVLHAKPPRHEQADGEAVLGRQGLTVHLVGHEGVLIQRIPDGERFGVAVRTAEDDLCGRGIDAARFRHDVPQAYAAPDRVADQVPADLVADALQRMRAAHRRHCLDVVVGQCQRLARLRGHLEPPAFRLEDRIESRRVLADGIELLIGGDLGRQALDTVKEGLGVCDCLPPGHSDPVGERGARERPGNEPEGPVEELAAAHRGIILRGRRTASSPYTSAKTRAYQTISSRTRPSRYAGETAADSASSRAWRYPAAGTRATIASWSSVTRDASRIVTASRPRRRGHALNAAPRIAQPITSVASIPQNPKGLAANLKRTMKKPKTCSGMSRVARSQRETATTGRPSVKTPRSISTATIVPAMPPAMNPRQMTVRARIMLRRRLQRGRGEDDVERLAVDHDGAVFGQIRPRRDLVVLRADVALELAQADITRGDVLPAAGLRVDRQVHVQVRPVRHLEVLKAQPALRPGPHDDRGPGPLVEVVGPHEAPAGHFARAGHGRLIDDAVQKERGTQIPGQRRADDYHRGQNPPPASPHELRHLDSRVAKDR